MRYERQQQQILKFGGCAGVASESILVYAYILMECFKNHGFVNEGFEVFGLVAVAGGGQPPKAEKEWRVAYSV